MPEAVGLVTQAYGVCLAGDLACLIIPQQDEKYHLPGGTVEDGETLEATLHREVWEEANLRISDVELLGLQEVNHHEGEHDAFGRSTYHQSRFVCRVKRAERLTVDPDKGYTYERVFVPLNDLNEYLGWGQVGDEIERLARQHR